jgi:hypothetical protein
MVDVQGPPVLPAVEQQDGPEIRGPYIQVFEIRIWDRKVRLPADDTARGADRITFLDGSA